MTTKDDAALAQGTFECPICGLDKIHAHDRYEIVKWLNAQGSRFGVSVIDAVLPISLRVDAIANSVAGKLVTHYWRGLVKYRDGQVSAYTEREAAGAREQHLTIRKIVVETLTPLLVEVTR